MNNQEELRKLISENPKLEIHFMVNEDCCSEYENSYIESMFNVEKTKIYNYGDRVYTEEDIEDLEYDVKENLTLYYQDEEGIELINEDLDKKVQENINKMVYKECILITLYP